MATPPRPARSGRTLGDDIERVGRGRMPFSDLYHFIMVTSWTKLLASFVLLYALLNVVFALAYLACGQGGIEHARPGNFWDAYFFSVQTMATIGYGTMAPRTFSANVVVAIEAFAGMLGFAFATGLIFAKFSRPTARVLWSRVAVISVFDGQRSLMLRLANERSNQIVEAQARVVLARTERTREGTEMRRFHELRLARSSTTIFALSWSLIHVIDESSPLYGATPEILTTQEAQIIVSVVGIDETFSQTVHARHAYQTDEILEGARFVDILTRLPDGRRRIDYTRFHDVER